MNLSDFTETKIIDHIFRTNTFAKIGTLYFALLSAAPSDAGGGTEFSGNGYARVAVTASDANFDAPVDATPSGRKTANTLAITFPAPTGAWGTATHFAVYDAASGGNEIAWGVLTNAKTIGASDPAPSWPAGAFVFRFDFGTTYLNDQLIKHLFRTGSFAKPATLGFAFYTVAPTAAGGGTECSGGSYARATVTPADTAFTATVTGDGHTENSGVITWPAPTANWGAALAIGLFDAASGGNLLSFGTFAARNINAGDSAPSLPVGQFDYTVA